MTERIAKRFAQNLRHDVGDETMEVIIAESRRRLDAGDDTCPSHEHTDPNESMLDAFEAITGREFDFQSTDDWHLESAAWTLAREKNFYM